MYTSIRVKEFDLLSFFESNPSFIGEEAAGECRSVDIFMLEITLKFLFSYLFMRCVFMYTLDIIIMFCIGRKLIIL